MENGESPDGAAHCRSSCEGPPEPRVTQARRTAGLGGADSWVFYGQPLSTPCHSLLHSGDLREEGRTSQTPISEKLLPGSPCQPSLLPACGTQRWWLEKGWTRRWRGLVPERHWAEVLRGAWALATPTPATVSRGAEGWPSLQETVELSPGCSWRAGWGRMPPSQPPQTQLTNCPTKWEMIYSDGWELHEICGFVEGGGGVGGR